MDCFFASVEMAENPSLRDIPIAISSNKRRSAIATCNYPARKFGVRSALGTHKALSLCPNLKVVYGRMDLYREYSYRVFQIFKNRGLKTEIVSIDEAYIDLEEYSPEDCVLLMEDIRKEIETNLKITASVGIAKNKFLAKICSDINKPNGCFLLREEDSQDFINVLPIKKFRGVGEKTYSKMVAEKILNGKMLKEKSIEELTRIVGKKRAIWFYNISRGIDGREVVEKKKKRKSISKSETFEKDTSNNVFFGKWLYNLCEKVSEKAREENIKGKTITIKVRFPDFTICSRSKTIENPINDTQDIYSVASKLIFQKPLTRKVRLLSVKLSNLEGSGEGFLW